MVQNLIRRLLNSYYNLHPLNLIKRHKHLCRADSRLQILLNKISFSSYGYIIEMIDPTTLELIGEICTWRYAGTSATGWLNYNNFVECQSLHIFNNFSVILIQQITTLLVQYFLPAYVLCTLFSYLIIFWHLMTHILSSGTMLIMGRRWDQSCSANHFQINPA